MISNPDNWSSFLLKIRSELCLASSFSGSRSSRSGSNEKKRIDDMFAIVDIETLIEAKQTLRVIVHNAY